MVRRTVSHIGSISTVRLLPVFKDNSLDEDDCYERAFRREAASSSLPSTALQGRHGVGTQSGRQGTLASQEDDGSLGGLGDEDAEGELDEDYQYAQPPITGQNRSFGVSIQEDPRPGRERLENCQNIHEAPSQQRYEDGESGIACFDRMTEMVNAAPAQDLQSHD
ncbi:MAG: hypothetical protein Q9170_002408 [Blastenia crenularia]